MNIEIQYLELLKDILENGKQKGDRTGTGTISLFGRQLRHTMSEGFPLLTTKKMYTRGIIVELLWFLRGETNIKYLVDNDCHIWDGDAYKNYQRNIHLDDNEKYRKVDSPELGSSSRTTPYTKEEFINKIKTDNEFAKQWGELGPIYGKQWKDWGGKMETLLTTDRDEEGYLKYETKHHKGIDQISNLINDLKNNPDSRRLIVNAWNVDEIDNMVLPPCHYGFQVYTRELNLKDRLYHTFKKLSSVVSLEISDKGPKFNVGFNPTDYKTHEDCDKVGTPRRAISLMWNQRSVDTLLGLPFNIASYAFLLCIIANEVNMIPDELICSLGDTHLYSNHIEQAKQQISRTPYKLPTLKIGHFGKILENISAVDVSDFLIEGYQSHSTIKAPLSN